MTTIRTVYTPTSTDTHAKSILLVDDFSAKRQIASQALEKAGFHTIQGTDGGEALSQLRAEHKVDLIVTDYHMPYMDGISFIKKVRKMAQFKDVPVILVSSTINEEVKQKAAKYGVTAFMQKPYKAEDLIRKINEML
ncbi:response regulator [Rapidithrix thailandica]|uniref:Response regulator n=1 Tax=Rapidithrix thailandica TaxID=413964 RepID=A0AAW9S787_9BACT